MGGRVVVVLWLFAVWCGASEGFEIEIVHMNDIHSHLDEEALDIVLEGKPTRVIAGGYGRIATKVKAARETGKNVLVLNAGDALQGTLYYTLFGGKADAAMMELVGWDAFVLGNHEFDNGDAPLARFLEGFKTPVIAANVEVKGKDPLEGKWRPYIIKRFGEAQVGIIGVDVARATKDASRPGKAIHFYDEIRRTQRYADELARKGVDKIILLSHCGFEHDLNLSKHVKGIDVIVGGHSHTLMGDFSNLGLPSELPYPVRSRSANDAPVCIVQAWAYAKVLGSLDVVFDDKGRVTSCSGNPVLMVGERFIRKDADGSYGEVNASQRQRIAAAIAVNPLIAQVAPDAAVASVLARYKKEVDVKKHDVIGRAAVELRHVRVPGETFLGNPGSSMPLGSELAPVVAKVYYERLPETDMSILNAGAVRTNLDAGPISLNTVYTMLPFANTLVTMDIRGRSIKKVLEDALADPSTGAFPYAYGIRYDVNMTAPAGSRISALEVMDRANSVWKSIRAEARYRVVTIDYLADGKNGYGEFLRVRQTGGMVDTYLEYAGTFSRYVKTLTGEKKRVEAVSDSNRCIQKFTASKTSRTRW